MVQVAFAATCVLTRLVGRGVCRVTAVGRLADTAVDGPQRAGDMYQKSSGTPLANWRRGHVQAHRSAHRGARYDGGSCVLEL